jgi:hypothetical protein
VANAWISGDGKSGIENVTFTMGRAAHG